MRRRPSADSAIPSHNAAHMPPSWPRPWRLSHLGSNVGTNIGAWKGVTKLETGGRNTAPVCYLNITDDELSESANLSDGGVAVLILDGCQKSVQQIHFKTKFLTTLLQWFRNKVLQIVKENSNCNWYLPPNKIYYKVDRQSFFGSDLCGSQRPHHPVPWTNPLGD